MYNLSLYSLIILMTLSIVIGNEHVIHSQDLDRFTQLESDFSTASKDRWSLILPELCRAAKTAPQQKQMSEKLLEKWDEFDHGTLAQSVKTLATNSPDSLFPLEAKIAELMTASNDQAAVLDLILAARDLRSSTNELQSALKKRMLDDQHVIAIHAAVTSFAHDPTYELAVKRLDYFLAHQQPEIIWRTAIALGDIGEKSARWLEELEKQLRHRDVRVRVAAAFAIWRAKHDSIRTAPVLIESLGHSNLPMPESFTYPSNAGRSQRVFAVTVLAEMKQQAVDAIPLLTEMVKKVDYGYPGEDWQEDQDSLLGLMSLVALASIASPNVELAKEVEKSTSREGSVFKLFSHRTADALAKLRNDAQ